MKYVLATALYAAAVNANEIETLEYDAHIGGALDEPELAGIFKKGHAAPH